MHAIPPRPQTERHPLFVGAQLQISLITIRPSWPEPGPVEVPEANVLALPLCGVFSHHRGPHDARITTPSHAVLIAAGEPYRIGFPGALGDQSICLAGSDRHSMQ